MPESADQHMIENVPFYPQETYQCGPASLAGVLNYWRIPEKPDDIAKDIFSENARGTHVYGEAFSDFKDVFFFFFEV